MTAPAAAPAAGGRLLSLAAVIATAAVFGLTYSLSATLIALDLAERGAGESVIGLNAAMHALGVLAIALVLPRVVGRIGSRRLTMGALVVAGLVLDYARALHAIIEPQRSPWQRRLQRVLRQFRRRHGGMAKRPA